MVVVVTYDSVVVDGLKETPFEVNQVLPRDAHHSHKTFHKTFDFLVIVEFIGDDGRDCKDPGAGLKRHFVLGRQTVSHEET